MRKQLIICTLLLIGISQSAWGWGRIGHDAIAYIAECNLTPKAKKNINKYLEHSIVFYASWMDDYRKTAEYKQTTYWHMASVDEDFNYTDEVKDANGDAVCELENAISKLENYQALDDSTVVVNLKYIIHLVGDMHCPSHVRYPDLKTGYKIQISGKEYSYHTVWDSSVIDLTRVWSYTEWQQQLDVCSRSEKKSIAAGTPRDWFHENAVNCRKIYDMAPEGSVQGRDFLNAVQPLSESQMLKAGYRLAKVLNDLFD